MIWGESQLSQLAFFILKTQYLRGVEQGFNLFFLFTELHKPEAKRFTFTFSQLAFFILKTQYLRGVEQGYNLFFLFTELYKPEAKRFKVTRDSQLFKV